MKRTWDKKGNLLTDFLYDCALPMHVFPTGHIRVTVQGKCGLLDANFQTLIEPHYYWIFYNGEGGYVAYEDRDTSQSVHVFSSDMEHSIVNLGVTVTSVGGGFEDGWGTVVCRVDDERRIGYIRPDGHWAIEPMFVDTGSFHNGLAIASEYGEYYGVIDLYGNWVIEPIYWNIVRDEDAGVFIVHKGDLVKSMIREDTLEVMTMPDEFDGSATLKGEYFYASDKNADPGKKGVRLYDIKGNLINQTQDYISVSFFRAGGGKATRYRWTNHYKQSNGNVLYDVLGNVIAHKDEIAEIIREVDD